MEFSALNSLLFGVFHARDQFFSVAMAGVCKRMFRNGHLRHSFRAWQRPQGSPQPLRGSSTKYRKFVSLVHERILLFRQDVAPPDSLCAQTMHETPVVKKKMEIRTGDSSELPPPDPYRANAP
jgi:hypothetical protein